MKAIGDTEENMILGGLEIMDGEPNNNNTKYANAIIDMTRLKGYEKTKNIEYDRYRHVFWIISAFKMSNKNYCDKMRSCECGRCKK